MDAKFSASDKQGTWSLAICWVQMGIKEDTLMAALLVIRPNVLLWVIVNSLALNLMKDSAQSSSLLLLASYYHLLSNFNGLFDSLSSPMPSCLEFSRKRSI